MGNGEDLEEEIAKARGNVWRGDGDIHPCNCGGIFEYIHMYKLIKWYTLSMCYLLYVNHASFKVFINKQTHPGSCLPLELALFFILCFICS